MNGTYPLSTFYSFQNDITIYIQSLQNPIFDIIFIGIGVLGFGYAYAILMLVTLFWFNFIAGLQIILLFALASIISTGFKLMFGQPRPYWTDLQVKAIQCESSHSFGIPSGHINLPFVILVWIMISMHHTVLQRAYLEPKNQLKFLPWYRLLLFSTCSGWLLLMFLSRIYTGVHYFTDMLTGVALGVAILGVYLYIAIPYVLLPVLRRAKEYHYNQDKQKSNLWSSITALTSIVSSVALLAFFLFNYVFMAEYWNSNNYQKIWFTNAMQQCPNYTYDPIHYISHYIIIMCGLIAGIGCGFTIDVIHFPFVASGVRWTKKLLRFGISLLLTLVFVLPLFGLTEGLTYVLNTNVLLYRDDSTGMVRFTWNHRHWFAFWSALLGVIFLNYVLGVLVGFWVSFVVPWICFKLNRGIILVDEVVYCKLLSIPTRPGWIAQEMQETSAALTVDEDETAEGVDTLFKPIDTSGENAKEESSSL